MKAWLTLADFAQVHAGKLFIVGGGINLTHAPVVMGVAAHVMVPWLDRSKRVEFKIALYTTDSKPVLLPTPLGPSMPMELGGLIETAPAPGTPEGSDLPVAVAFNVHGLPLQVDSYEWRLYLHGSDKSAASATFAVIAPARYVV